MGGASTEYLAARLLLLRLQRLGLHLGVGEVDRHQDQLLVGEVLEFLGVEDLVMEALAPDAPVRAREIEEEQLVLLLGLGGSRGVVLGPVGGSRHGDEKEGGRAGRQESTEVPDVQRGRGTGGFGGGVYSQAEACQNRAFTTIPTAVIGPESPRPSRVRSTFLMVTWALS